MKVGDTLWEFDDNRRVYDENRRIIYRAHFVERKIVGETKQSWIVYPGDTKVSKKDLTYAFWSGGRRRMYANEQQVEEKCWDNDHRYKVTEAVRKTDTQTLRRIAELIGYKGAKHELRP
jgi:hypothetical protein